MALMNDGRAAAKAVNALLQQYEAQRPFPKLEREVQYIHKAWVFGHYDSRGGGSLVIAPNIIEAIKKYVADCGWDEKDAVEFGYDAAYEDLQNQGLFHLVVLDRELPTNPTDLMAGFTGEEDGYLGARLQIGSPSHEDFLEEMRARREGRPVPAPKKIEWRDAQVICLYRPKSEEETDVWNDLDNEESVVEGLPLPAGEHVRWMKWDPSEDACGLAYTP